MALKKLSVPVSVLGRFSGLFRLGWHQTSCLESHHWLSHLFWQNLGTFCHVAQSIFLLTQTLCVTLYQHKDEQPVNEVTVCREEKHYWIQHQTNKLPSWILLFLWVFSPSAPPFSYCPCCTFFLRVWWDFTPQRLKVVGLLGIPTHPF